MRALPPLGEKSQATRGEARSAGALGGGIAARRGRRGPLLATAWAAAIWAVFVANSQVIANDVAPSAVQATSLADDASTASPSPATLIAALGDESYFVRHVAEAALLDRGESIRSALSSAAQAHGDLEVRRRSVRLLEALDEVRARKYREALETRLAEFVEDDDAERHDYGFPGWKSYRGIAGGDRQARALFAEMQRSEPELLSLCEGETEPLSRAVAARFLQIAQSMSHPLPQFRTSITPGRAAALYFVAAHKDISLDARAGSQLYSLANQPTVRVALTSVTESGPLKKVMGNWIATDQSGDRNLGYYKVLLATRNGLKEGRQAGLNIISDKDAGVPAHQFLQAVLAIGRFGEKEDIEKIESLLNNNTICQTMNVNRVQYTTQVRDAALVALLHLTGQDHREYGFDRLQKNEQTLFNVTTMGFSRDDEKRRDEAIAKWRRWSAVNRKPEPTPEPPEQPAQNPTPEGK